MPQHAQPHMSPSSTSEQTHSDHGRGDPADIVTDSVMADQSTQHVVNNAESVADPSSIDAHTNNPTTATAGNGQAQPLQHADSKSLPEPNSDLNPISARSILADSAPTINLDGVTATSTGTLNQQDATSAGIEANGFRDANPGLEEHGAGGSDTDTSKADSTDQQRDGQGRTLRSNSVKKPTLFKPVSVTKAFLAKSASAAPVTKVGEKGPTNSTLQTSVKPRLIAKSGSGLRDIPRVRSAADGANGPDGNTVWNKNRPAPPPPPRQFTDEELKQQYGIHLATRLQSDEPGKESKWADIDDDEEDWVPETVEWMDGTKSTTAPKDAQPIPTETPEPAPKKQDEQAPSTKPVLTTLKRQTSLNPTRTILKPGAAAQQAKQSGVGARGAPERPTLVAKSPAPAPVKSPWAPLPPVDKVSPVVINPPPQPQPTPNFGQRDPHGFDAMPQTSPAREIATDTFDRSWRENERGNRELFNAHSNRYEPAPEFRRGSKQDHGFRQQPAVLQRPSQQNMAQPEPSAAFQTSRSSGQMDGASWGRRRGSSVSGGSSVPRDRRMSFTRNDPAVLPNDARGATVVGRDVSTSPQAMAHTPAFPTQSPWQQQMPPPPPRGEVPPADFQAPPTASMQDEVARQKEVMREKREAAIRRRREEEEREEAARKERIRLKMEQLGMAPLGPKKDEAKSPGPEKQAEQQALMDTVVKTASSLQGAPHEQASQPTEASASEAAKLEAQAQPASETSLQQQQPQQPPKESTPISVPPPQLEGQHPVHQLPLKPVEAPQLPVRQTSSPSVQARGQYQQQPPLQGLAAASSYSSPGEQKPQPSWKSPSLNNDLSAPWGHNSIATHAVQGGNVWGPPNANRGIGNGTFDNSYRIASNHHQHQAGGFGASSFGRLQPNRMHQQGFHPPSRSPEMHHPLADHPQTARKPTMEPFGLDSMGGPQPNGVSPTGLPTKPAYQPKPIAPPPRRIPSQESGDRNTSSWLQFSAQAEERQVQAQADAEAAVRDAHKHEAPSSTSVTQQRWRETYKQTGIEEKWLGGPRKVMAMEKTTHGEEPSAVIHVPSISQAEPVEQQGPQQVVGDRWQQPAHESTVRLPAGPEGFVRSVSSQSMADSAHTLTPHQSNALPQAPAVSAPQQSRFFPSALYGGSPPPEESDHPVYSGNAKHPHVSLPAPKPKVRLPPAPAPAAPAQSSPVIMPQRMPHRVGAQPLVQSSDWQARFNGLFGKAQITTTTPPSPPKTPPKAQAPAPAIASSSKDAMDLTSGYSSTTVSLPQNAASSAAEAVVDDSVTSKPTVDDIFDGELEFGSTPKVVLPRNARYEQTFADKENVKILNVRPFFKFNKASVEAQSKYAFLVGHEEGKHTITVHMPLSERPAKELQRQRRFPARNNFQDRKTSSGKFNKDGILKVRRGGPETMAKENSPKNATPTASPKSNTTAPPKANVATKSKTATDAAKRTTSYQQPKGPVAPSIAAIPTANAYAALAIEEPRSPRKSWKKKGAATVKAND